MQAVATAIEALATKAPSTLYFGDNLQILKDKIDPESVDLIYLDPPFNSKADYNILFKEATGEKSHAQMQAFSDFWRWDDIESNRAKGELIGRSPYALSELVESLSNFLGKSDMMAYLLMMAVRLVQLHKVLKPRGSLFLHCDPRASHYLKLVLDSIFDHRNFRSEIIWKRTSSHNDAHRFAIVHDTILHYSRNEDFVWNTPFKKHDEKYLKTHYTGIDLDGRKYRLDNPTGPGHGRTAPSRRFGDRVLEPPPGTHWRWSQQNIDRLMAEGLIVFTSTGMPARKRYLDPRGMPVNQSVWVDIAPENSQARDRQGFQTQKPVPLLERIISSCSNEGDLILDPFCGCGTTIIAAQKLNRRWTGIDIAYAAIHLVKERLKREFPEAQFQVSGEPKDMDGARELAGHKDRYPFEWWAVSLVGAHPRSSTNARPNEGKRGADMGFDGWLKFHDADTIQKALVQVKSGQVGVKEIRDFRGTLDREKAAIGLFITLEDPTSEMLKEAKTAEPYMSVWKQEYPKIQILRVEDLLKKRQGPKLPPIVVPEQVTVEDSLSDGRQAHLT